MINENKRSGILILPSFINIINMSGLTISLARNPSCYITFVKVWEIFLSEDFKFHSCLKISDSGHVKITSIFEIKAI